MIDDGTLQDPCRNVPVAIKITCVAKGNADSLWFEDSSNRFQLMFHQTDKIWKRQETVILGRDGVGSFNMGSTTQRLLISDRQEPGKVGSAVGDLREEAVRQVCKQEAPLLHLDPIQADPIRQPSSFCGVVGIKPTYGTVSVTD